MALLTRDISSGRWLGMFGGIYLMVLGQIGILLLGGGSGWGERTRCYGVRDGESAFVEASVLGICTYCSELTFSFLKEDLVPDEDVIGTGAFAEGVSVEE